MNKSYSELINIDSYIERYRYLKIGNDVGEETFGFHRTLNQILYSSRDWRIFRKDIVVRDLGTDMAMLGREIIGKIIVHHINPLSLDDVYNRRACIFDPENVVCVSMMTHQAIHYGDETLLLPDIIIERAPYDMCPWKNRKE